MQNRLKEYSNYYSGACPIHGGDNPTCFCLRKETMHWKCYTHSCHGSGSFGDIFDLVHKMLKLDFGDTFNFIKSVYGVGEIDPKILSRISFEESAGGLLCRNMSVAGEMKSLPRDMEDFYSDFYDEYYEKRGYSRDLLRYFNVGFCPKNVEDDPLNGYFAGFMTIPVHDASGNLVGFTGRNTDGSSTFRWKHSENLPKALVLYNLHRAMRYATDNLILAESPGVVWDFHRAGYYNSVASLGACISKEQIKLILRQKKINSVTLAFDSDKAGRDATAKAIKMLYGKINVFVCALKNDQDYNDLSSEEIALIYHNRKVCSNEELQRR